MPDDWSAGLFLRFAVAHSSHLLFRPADNIAHLHKRQRGVREYGQSVLSSKKNGANKKDPNSKTMDLPFMLPAILLPVDKSPLNFFRGHRSPGHIQVKIC